MADRISQATSAVNELGAGDYAALSMDSDQLVQKSEGRPDLKELILRAGKSVLHNYRYGQEKDCKNALTTILEQYIQEVYESEFKERIPLTSEHYVGVDQETLSMRIEEMQPDINIGIKKFTKDIIKNQSIARLSLPRRSSRKEIDLDENLLGN